MKYNGISEEEYLEGVAEILVRAIEDQDNWWRGLQGRCDEEGNVWPDLYPLWQKGRFDKRQLCRERVLTMKGATLCRLMVELARRME